MGTFVLFFALLLEAGILASRLISRSRLEITRGIVRLVALVVFLILVLASVIQWSWRWYGLAILLFSWCAADLTRLFVSQPGKKPYSPHAVIGETGLSLLLILLALTPALLFPQVQMPPATGPYAVDRLAVSYIDAGRIETYDESGAGRRLNVEFWFPHAATERCPLVVFSHGGLGVRTSNQSLYQELASHGYVVAALDHSYQAFFTRDDAGRITLLSGAYLKELQREDARSDKVQSLAYYQKWMGIRVGDLDFLLDTILQHVAEGSPGVYRLIDRERIGVMGHSLGGSAALGIARERRDIDAVAALESPFLHDIIGVSEDRFLLIDAPFPRPLLSIYSDSAWEHLAEWPQYVRNHALLSEDSPTIVNMHLCGGGHFSLTDLALSSPLLVRGLEGELASANPAAYLRRLNSAVLEFFNRFLKHQSPASTPSLPYDLPICGGRPAAAISRLMP